MIQGKSILAIIPARGGSKGVPRKNVREVHGKPLIAYTIEEANKSKYIDKLILSSDDEEIIKVAKAWGCEVPFTRPKELALDNTPGIDPVLHALDQLPGYDLVVLLQPTSPLRRVEDIDECIEVLINNQAKACVSVTEPDKSPFWMYTINNDGKMSPIVESTANLTRRQELPKVYALNGAVYVANSQWLQERKSFLTEETIAFPMAKERSVDIDTEMDMLFLELLLQQKGKNK